MSPRQEGDADAQKEIRRWQILQAGLKVFAQKGFAAAGMKEVAEAAGVSYGLAYHYFASKDVLFSALVELALDSSIAQYQKAMAIEGDPGAKLRFLVAGVLAAMDDELSPLFFLLMIQASTMAGLPETVRTLFAKRLGEYDQLLRPVIEEGQKLSLVRAGAPEIHATYLGAIFHGLAIARAVTPGIPLPDAEGILREILI
jgi:AcrR family transcriptional regulator